MFKGNSIKCKRNWDAYSEETRSDFLLNDGHRITASWNCQGKLINWFKLRRKQARILIQTNR